VPLDSVAVATVDRDAGRALAPERSRQIGDQRGLLELGDRARDLTHKPGGRRVLDEVCLMIQLPLATKDVANEPPRDTHSGRLVLLPTPWLPAASAGPPR
jgi:hypothetical protein